MNINELKKLVKQCICEMKNHSLIKECIEEVLKEDLLEHDQHGREAQDAFAGPFDPREFAVNKEGFDPQSNAGPNPAATEGSQYNPYEEWNEKMARMEEVEEPIHNKVSLEEKLKKLETIFSVLQTRQQKMSSHAQIELNQCVEEIAQVLKRYWNIISHVPVNEEESNTENKSKLDYFFHGVYCTHDKCLEWKHKLEQGQCPWCNKSIAKVHNNQNKHLRSCPHKPAN